MARLDRTSARDRCRLFLGDCNELIREIVEHVYRHDPHSKLDEFLGPDSRWRERLDGLAVASGVHKRWLFAEIYKSQLQRHLQYCEFDDKSIEDAGRPLYKLIYASRHKLGLKFWRQAVKKDSSGQRDLFD